MALDNVHDIGSGKQVFIDWELIEPGYGLSWGGERPTSWEMPHGVRIAVHRPRIDLQPLIVADRPWESMVTGIVTLMEDEGRYRMWYECWSLAEGEDSIGKGGYPKMLAYAESTDGANWVKPRLGTVSFGGSTDNNIVYGLDLPLGRTIHGAGVFKDPSASPDERYKLVCMTREGIGGAVSPDGLRWKALEQLLVPGYLSDTPNVARFDAERGRYVGYFRGWGGWTASNRRKNTTGHGRRTIAYAESDRFESWPWPQTIVAPSVNDDPDTDIYTNSYAPWPDAPDAHLMFPGYYQRTRDVREVHLLTSRDGIDWHRPASEPIIPCGEPGSDWGEGSWLAGAGLVSVHPGEWSLPVRPQSRSHNQYQFPIGLQNPPNHGELCLATWREDGFTSLEAEAQGGCSTMPIVFKGGRLEINAWTRFGGEIRIELADPSGETFGASYKTAEAIAGHTFEDCDPISGGVLKHVVTWNGESDLSAWAGRPVRLRFSLRRARLFAFQFV